MTLASFLEAQCLRMDLWPGAPPGERGPALEEHAVPEGAVGGIDVPVIEVYRPPEPNGSALLILGGGGYRHIQMVRESNPAANLALSLGMTAVILKHRLPIDGWKPLAPLQDAQRALRLIRKNAAAWGIANERIGVLGFSAGGHLAAMLSTRFDLETYAAIDDTDWLSARPDFAALLFPVISLEPPFEFTATKRMLSRDDAGADQLQRYSPHRLVTAAVPPTFLAHAADDKVAPPEHSILMFQALKAASVSAELHIFPTGGHGSATGAQGSRFHLWQTLFSSWVEPWLRD
ncbi:alpha/beta hydrolase [Rhizobium sp. P38BS-XIX]|uniref:alpha/beta hydrolase n=1 Tax=Rhizobium sp. P38BS-XIX TaxID=2726740 RepID=UPI001456514B|nr:alpha/beta hydrolase [Rhizobium sp. P38BS-XIX]NLS01095.1 alpha/beta hydrolase [Rhizobium sp. P38BS-XIX]